VRNNLNSIVTYLKSNPSASDTLSRIFIEKGWLNVTATATADRREDQLVTLVLGRIELDVNQYGEFIAILNDVPGMDLIVKKKLYGPLLHAHTFTHVSTCTTSTLSLQ